MSSALQKYLTSNKNKSFSGTRPYADVLTAAQEYMSSTYQDILSSDLMDNDVKLIKEYINQYLVTKNIKCGLNIGIEELVDKLYMDMAEFSFITVWLRNAQEMHLEEININSWDDIEVITSGQKRKAEEKFISPQHAIDVVRRMLQKSGKIIDDGTPTALGSLAKNIRITAIKTPVLDNDVGIAASIRIVSGNHFSKEKLIDTTATIQMLDFLTFIVKYGVSLCIAGNTGSGKTSTTGWILSTIPDDKRIFTIEEGSREFDLVRRDEDGKVKNRVIHTITKNSIDQASTISQEDLLDISLRFHPDVICVGEMRSKEAFAAQEAARTGHTVITTIHSKTAAGAYMRMTTLAKRAYEFSEEMLIKMMIEAFPIIVYQRQLEDSSRKITEIIEGEDYENGKVVYRTLYRYVVEDNEAKDGKVSVRGHFEKANEMTERLKSELMQNGASRKMIEKF